VAFDPSIGGIYRVSQHDASWQFTGTIDMSSHRPDIQKEAYTVTEFCETTGLSRATAYRIFKAGVITPRKAGNRTLILGEDLRAYLNSLPVADIVSAATGGSTR